MTVLESWLHNLSTGLNELGNTGLFSQTAFTNGHWNRYSWLHARMLGAMVRAVPTPFTPMVEVKWHGRFTPDLCLARCDDGRDRVYAVIEYESTNSSDERLQGKDLRHYLESIKDYKGWEKDPADRLPPLWVIVSTLPDQAVQGWRWWPWNKNTDFRPARKCRKKRDSNPFKYYEEALHSSFENTWSRIPVSTKNRAPDLEFVWVNLFTDRIEVMNVNGEPQRGRAFPMRLPPGGQG